MNRGYILALAVGICLVLGPSVRTPSSQTEKPESGFRRNVPKVWDEAALSDWATPLAGLNARPTHISAKDYYSLPVENLRTYPVYYPGREPEGYWEMLQHVAPKPLIEPEKLRTQADWIEAGRRVFEEADHLHLRTFDPTFIADARSPETYKGMEPAPDGTVTDLRWVPTKEGVALGFPNCRNCHLQYLPDGTQIPGAPTFATSLTRFRSLLIGRAQTAKRVIDGGMPFFMGPEPFGARLYQAFGVPWRESDINQQLKDMTQAEYSPIRAAFAQSGGVPRWNGSLYYPAKVPDLIGIKDRKYIDHTATHLNRGVGDLMRYAALVSFAEATDFGPYRVLLPDTKRAQARLPDEALYALALYIYSLQPPPNPNPFDDKARVGEKIFEREGCPVCHTPPLYTNNKLTLALGFTPPKDAPATLDILPISVGTDPGLALDTRKGTGYYKVPSLKGVWYRGRFGHSGWCATLEDWFDPRRTRDDYVPTGFKPYGVKTYAVKGHPFGLDLAPEDKKALVAFLKTL
jgi:hypothetical protein